MWLIVSKNIDSFNNPTILSLLKLLEERKIKVLFFQKKSIFKYHSPNVKQLFYFEKKNRLPKKLYDLVIISKNLRAKLILRVFASKITRVIGVDQAGVLWADQLNSTLIKCKRLDYFSFEIDSICETVIKKREIEVCNRVNNIVTQDQSREILLRLKNNINENNSVTFHHIPVSYSKRVFGLFPDKERIGIFREKYKIDNEIKLILFMGTFDRWSGSEYILKILEEDKLPENVIFVIHSRFKLSAKDEIMKYTGSKNLILDDQYIDDVKELFEYVRQFDFGLALYCTDNSHKWLGDNLNHIGLSSGKFSFYMLCNLPAITTNQQIFQNLLLKYNYGYCINTYEEFKDALINGVQFVNQTTDCNRLFNEVLEPTEFLINYIDS